MKDSLDFSICVVPTFVPQLVCPSYPSEAQILRRTDQNVPSPPMKRLPCVRHSGEQPSSFREFANGLAASAATQDYVKSEEVIKST